ncbi:hypothetical protein D3C86_1598660 [compost metagenome]
MKLSEHNLHQFTFDEISNKAYNGCLEYDGDVNTLVRFLIDSIDEKVQQELEDNVDEDAAYDRGRDDGYAEAISEMQRALEKL